MKGTDNLSNPLSSTHSTSVIDHGVSCGRGSGVTGESSLKFRPQGPSSAHLGTSRVVIKEDPKSTPSFG